MADCWKDNWSATKANLCKWWKQQGLVVGSWGTPRGDINRGNLPAPEPAASVEDSYLDSHARIERNHRHLARSVFPLDILPKSSTNFGPGSLATFLGAEPHISPQTVWFEPTIQHIETPEALPPFTFDPENKWFKHMAEFLAGNMVCADGAYLVPMPDLVENIDILASLRDNQELMMDMIMRPDWVLEKLTEINHVYFQAFDALYDIIKQPDGSNAFDAFSLWGPGKTAKVQCDASAMFSPDMFKQFVVPALTEQCEWLDYSMFHLDGHQCIPHLDHLLEIDALDAIEWTPDPNVPSGGDPHWYPMYRRILDAGKSIQAVGVKHDEIEPLLDAVGTDGLYILTHFTDEASVETVAKIIEPYRRYR